MKKLELKYMNPEMARTFRYLMVPSVLLDNEDYSDIDDGAKLLYSKMLERLGWSSCHLDKFTDKNGRVFILYTVENMQKDLQRSHPTIVKFTKQLEAKGLIEKVRQGQGKPSKIYIKDFASAPRKEPEKPSSKEAGPLEVKDLNFKKSKGFTSRSKDSELQEVKDFNPIELENKELENNELPSYQPPGDWKEGGVEGIADEVREQIEYDVLREEYGKELSDEVVEIITEVRCRDSPDMQIGKGSYPMDLVVSRMKSLTCEHVRYVLDSLGRAGPVRNPHRYLLALLFNAPASCNTAVQAVFNANDR